MKSQVIVRVLSRMSLNCSRPIRSQHRFHCATLCETRSLLSATVHLLSVCLSVCLSVRLFVTFVYCIQTAEDIVNFFSQPSSSIILVFFTPCANIKLQHSPILGLLSIDAYTICCRTTKFDVVTWGEGRVYWVSHASHPRRAEFQRSPSFVVLLYLCLHRLMQNDQIWHGDTWGGVCF